jgi:hypothetical protein
MMLVPIRTTVARPMGRAATIVPYVMPASDYKSRWAWVRDGRPSPFLGQGHIWLRSASVQVIPDYCVPIGPLSYCSPRSEEGSAYHIQYGNPLTMKEVIG